MKKRMTIAGLMLAAGMAAASNEWVAVAVNTNTWEVKPAIGGLTNLAHVVKWSPAAGDGATNTLGAAGNGFLISVWTGITNRLFVVRPDGVRTNLVAETTN